MIYVELILYLGVFLFILSRKRVFELFENQPAATKIVLGLTAFMIIFGQIHKKSSETYPFAHWGMYDSVYPGSSYLEYDIVLTDSSQFHYPFKLVTFTSQRAFIQTMDDLYVKKDDHTLLKKTLDSLAKIYEKNYPEHAVDRFVLYEVDIEQDTLGNVYKEREPVFSHYPEP